MGVKEKTRYLKKVMLGVFIFLIIFTQQIIFLSMTDHQIPDSLIVAVFGFAGVEAGAGAWLKYIEESCKKKGE